MSSYNVKDFCKSIATLVKNKIITVTEARQELKKNLMFIKIPDEYPGDQPLNVNVTFGEKDSAPKFQDTYESKDSTTN